MKTNVFFKAVVMVAVVMASVMSANAGNPTNYVKNDEMNGEQLVAKTIYRMKTVICSATSATRILMIPRTGWSVRKLPSGTV